jgi:hypothetical protein
MKRQAAQNHGYTRFFMSFHKMTEWALKSIILSL